MISASQIVVSYNRVSCKEACARCGGDVDPRGVPMGPWPMLEGGGVACLGCANVEGFKVDLMVRMLWDIASIGLAVDLGDDAIYLERRGARDILVARASVL